MPWKYSKSKAIRQRQYKEYLKSPKWKAKRAAALKRDKGMCRLCGEFATQVHHATYKRRGKERISDLTSLCQSCHEKFHKGK